MGFIVQEIPFGGEVVSNGAGEVVGVGESFDAGAKDGEFLPKFEGALPNDSADVF